MKKRSFSIAKVLVALFLFVSVVLPLLRLLTNINPADVKNILTAPQFKPMIINSLATTCIATIISVVFGMDACVVY